ncbi:MAG TPA: tyrosine-type recombinase/integrase [Candidatus Limnocylindria bacterium]|jgi:integrase|nr:tyrosine-type recombinase/integrase [Candidatus Limnocylindria bacterium]
MKTQFTLYKRGDTYYAQDTVTGKQSSLRTKDEAEANTLIHARNEATRQSFLNLRIAQTYLAASDKDMVTRTWQDVMDEFIKTRNAGNRLRVTRATVEAPFDLIRQRPVIETQAQHFLRVLEAGGVSTNIYLRRFHNFALGMNWLPWPILPKKQWPSVHHKEKRAVTREEHQRIMKREPYEDLRAFYDCCWHLGGAQGDVAKLKAEDIDWRTRVVSFFRSKTGAVQIVHFGDSFAATLQSLPASGPLFPRLALMNEKQRASLFQRICRRLKITGVSLHSYRYAWAERAKTAGYPERFAQEALGHNSKAIHRAYARKAQVVLPALEDFERKMQPALVPILRMPQAVA